MGWNGRVRNPGGVPNMTVKCYGSTAVSKTASRGSTPCIVAKSNIGSVIVRKHTDGGTAVESVLGVLRPSTNLLPPSVNGKPTVL